MDLLSEDEDEKQQVAPGPVQPQQNSAVHLYDPFKRPVLPIQTSAPQAPRGDATDSIIQQPDSVSRPPTQKSAAPSSPYDLLTLMVRAHLRGPIKRDPVTPEEALAEHALTCKDDGCTFGGSNRCLAARRNYQHYQMCNKDVCNTCANVRLYVTKAKQGLSPKFEEEFRFVRNTLLRALDALKQADAARKALIASENGEASAGSGQGASEELRRATEELRRCHERYGESKRRYEESLQRLYAMWKQDGPSLSQAGRPPVTSANPRLSTSSTQSGPVASAIVSQGAALAPLPRSLVTASTNGSVNHLVAPLESASKRSEEMLNGFSMGFSLGESANLMLEEFEGVLESLTTSIAKTSQWRGPSDFTEPEWSEANVVTKRELETEQNLLAGSKRLFSNNEMEFVSRAAQEIMADAIAACAQRAKHGRYLSGESGEKPVRVDVKELKTVLRSSIAARTALLD